MSDVPAHWGLMKRALEIRDSSGSETFILGNGDVEGLEDAKQKAKESGAGGIMLGKAIFGNPWLFSGHVPSVEEKLEVMIEHTKLFEELLGDIKNFAIMKKHYKAYVNGFDGAKELRMQLMEAENAREVERITREYLEKVGDEKVHN